MYQWSTLCDPMDYSTSGFSVRHQRPELAQTHVHRVGDAISSSIISFSSQLQSFPASGSFPRSQFFPSVAKLSEFQLQHSTSNEYSGLISFRIEWLDRLVVQGTLKSLLQHHSSKHQFFSTHFSLQSSNHIHNNYWKNHSFDQMDLCQEASLQTKLVEVI